MSKDFDEMFDEARNNAAQKQPTYDETGAPLGGPDRRSKEYRRFIRGANWAKEPLKIAYEALNKIQLVTHYISAHHSHETKQNAVWEIDQLSALALNQINEYFGGSGDR